MLFDSRGISSFERKERKARRQRYPTVREPEMSAPKMIPMPMHLDGLHFRLVGGWLVSQFALRCARGGHCGRP